MFEGETWLVVQTDSGHVRNQNHAVLVSLFKDSNKRFYSRRLHRADRSALSLHGSRGRLLNLTAWDVHSSFLQPRLLPLSFSPRIKWLFVLLQRCLSLVSLPRPSLSFLQRTKGEEFRGRWAQYENVGLSLVWLSSRFVSGDSFLFSRNN